MRGTLTVLITSLVLALPVQAGQQLVPEARVAAITPLAMQYFCRDNPRECRGGGSAQVTLTPDLLSKLSQVNVEINRSIRARSEREDVWSLNPASGDCEDFVLSKRSALVRLGVPASALRIAHTQTRSGVAHAVLIARTNEGDLVLDNLNNSVKTLRASGYRIKAMSGANPGKWTAG